MISKLGNKKRNKSSSFDGSESLFYIDVMKYLEMKSMAIINKEINKTSFEIIFYIYDNTA